MKLDQLIPGTEIMIIGPYKPYVVYGTIEGRYKRDFGEVIRIIDSDGDPLQYKVEELKGNPYKIKILNNPNLASLNENKANGMRIQLKQANNQFDCLLLKNILNEVIKEVGEGSSQPFKYTQEDRSVYTIYGETSKGDNIETELKAIVGGDWLIRNSIDDPELAQKVMGQNGMYISFKIKSINGEKPGFMDRYKEVNDIRYMYRFMATLKQIILPRIKKEDVDLFFYSPTFKTSKDYAIDGGRGRDILYKLFLKKEFPNAELHGETSKRVVILNR